MSEPQLDPEVFQALTDLRPVYAAWRKAKSDMRKLTSATKSREYHAAREYAGDQWSIMRTRSDRLTIGVDALVVILAADAALKTKLKRRASRAQLGKALVEEAGEMVARNSRAKGSLERAQREADAAARALTAAQEARLAVTGYVG